MAFAKAGPEVKNHAFASLGKLTESGALKVIKTADLPPPEEVKGSDATEDVREEASPSVPPETPLPVEASSQAQEAPQVPRERKEHAKAKKRPEAPKAREHQPPKKGSEGDRRRRRHAGEKDERSPKAGQKQANVVAPQFAKPGRPHGSLSLGYIVSSGLTKEALAERVTREGKSDFVVYRSRQDGDYDLIRVGVLVKQANGKAYASFVVQQATGVFGTLEPHVGEEIDFDALRSLLCTKPSQATILLADAMREAKEILARAAKMRAAKAA